MLVIDFLEDNSASVRRRHQCCQKQASDDIRERIQQQPLLCHESGGEQPQNRAVSWIGSMKTRRSTTLLPRTLSLLSSATATLMASPNQKRHRTAD
jgi:hypothetical protein